MLSANTKKASREYLRRCARARAHLRAQGWSVRRAARHLERNYVHLYYCLSGQRHSEPLIARVLALPKSPIEYTHTGFALHKQAA